MSDDPNEDIQDKRDPEGVGDTEGESEGHESEKESVDYGEGLVFDSRDDHPTDYLRGEYDDKEWVGFGEYGEAVEYFFPQGEATEYSSIWGEKEGSVTSAESGVISEVEETEEEKELRREREMLIENLKSKLMERMLLRRKNAFLHKKLSDHYKKRRMDNVFKEDPKGLDLENKYLKRLYAFKEFKVAQENEIEELSRLMEQYKTETTDLQRELEEKFKNSVARAKDVSLNLILSKTGKKLNEKTVDRLLRRQIEKSEEKGKKKLLYIKIKNLIEEKEQKLKSMEYFGNGLRIADYEQMKIDNQNFSDKIEEKEDELTKLRLKTQVIIQNVANVREKTNAIEGDIELMEEKVYEVEKTYADTRRRLTLARIKRDSNREEFRHLKTVSGLLTRDVLLKDFEKSIDEAHQLKKSLAKIKKAVADKNKRENELARMVAPSGSELISQNLNYLKTRHFSGAKYVRQNFANTEGNICIAASLNV